MSRLRRFWQANRAELLTTGIIVLIVVVFVAGFVALIVSEFSKVYVNYVGEITSMEVKFNEETCEEQFLLTVKLDTGDERVLKMSNSPQDTSFYFTLNVGERHEFNVLLVDDPNLNYHGTLITLNDSPTEKTVYESAN